MLPLLLLLASSPSLDAIVALGRGEPHPPAPMIETSTTTPSLPLPPSSRASTERASTERASTEPSPWAGVGMLIALGGGAFALWWRRRGATSTGLLEIKQSVAVGRGRALLVAEVDGRRVLLSSSEAGVTLLLDLGASTAHVSFEATVDALTPSMAVAASVDAEGHEIQRRLAQAHARGSA